MQKEIEVKIQIKPEFVDILQNWLENNAKFITNLVVTDHYMDNPKSSFYSLSPLGYKETLQFLRLRITDKDHFICYKKRHIDLENRTASVDECQTKVEDGHKLLELLNCLGYTNQTLVQKKQQFYMIDDTFELVIDDIKNLGEFIEIELKKEVTDVKTGIQMIYDLLKKIGITEFKSFDRGYLCMTLNPDYDFSEDVNL